MAINHGESKWAICLTWWVCMKLQMLWLTYERGWVLVSGANKKPKNGQSGMGVCVCDRMVSPADTGLGAVLWLPGALMKCTASVVIKIKRRWIKLLRCFTVNPGRAFLLKIFALLSLTTLTPVICWSFWSIKGNGVICTPGARMGAFKHLKCMQRSLMPPGPWLLQRPLQILESGPEWGLNKLCAYAIKTKLCCFLSTHSTRQGCTELRHCCVGISLIPRWREIGSCAAKEGGSGFLSPAV